MSFEVHIRNPEGTRSTKLKLQAQLDIIRDVINDHIPKKRFDAECRKRMIEAGCPPDFDGPDSKVDFVTADQALAVLSEIEYSSDGFVKRYPNQDRYDAAVAFLKEKCAPKKKS